MLSCCCCCYLQVIDAVNALAVGQPDNTATAEAGAVITDCVQVRKGMHVPNLEQM
jgi:alkyl hydroperoxide reductase subunit AhpF